MAFFSLLDGVDIFFGSFSCGLKSWLARVDYVSTYNRKGRKGRRYSVKRDQLDVFSVDALDRMVLGRL